MTRTRIVLEIPLDEAGRPTGDSSVLVVGADLNRERVAELLLDGVRAYYLSWYEQE